MLPNLFILRPLRTFLAALPLAFLAGCAVGPEPRSPAPESLGVPDAFAAAWPASAATQTPADVATWWRAFDDPTLATLVEQALAENTDVEAAAARVRQARASLSGTRASYWPTLGAGVTASRRFDDDGAGGDRTVYDAGFDASYEVDLFGGVRRSVQASAADLGATEAAAGAVRLAIASEVALNYFDARLAQRRLAIAQANLDSQAETLQIVDWRVQAGLVGSLDLEQARRLRAQTAAAVPSIERDFAAASNRLATLTSQRPSQVRATLATVADIPLAAVPAASIPADTVRQRPDVWQSERTLVAEVARIGVRQADLLPALRLTGSFGGTGTTVSNAWDVAAGSLIAGLTAPLFEGGRLRAALEAQRAAADAALANYRGTLQVAVEETENALTAVSVSERRERELLVADEAARNATLLARSQYQTGLIDFQTLLDSERSLLATQDSVAGARAERATALVQLYKALGGGWDAAAAGLAPAHSAP